MDICITSDIGDRLTMGENDTVSAIIRNAKDILMQGSAVTLVRNFEDGTSVILGRFVTEQELDDFKEKLNASQEILGRPAIP